MKSQLPIDTSLPQIKEAFKKHSNLVITASPGSGKTTRIPPELLTDIEKGKKIIVLVPKRIAAVGAADRVADENGWIIGDHHVGYHVRFDNRTVPSTRLIYMTTGLFIKKVADENFWNSLGLIVFDEFHERTSLLDLALGLSLERQIMGSSLKLIVMSATLNAEKIQNFLPDCKWIDVANRAYHLQIIKSKKSQRLICDHTFVENLVETLKQGLKMAERDTLIFLPGLGEMRFTERILRSKFNGFDIFLLHGSMKLEEQRSILHPPESVGRKRRLILATNIAESSVTIPSVDLVIDSGLEKKSIVENKIGFSRLELTRISLFSAHQRAGRAARTSNGFCFQMWHEADERSMPAQIEPEIKNSPLLEEALTLLSAGVSEPEKFSWLDEPLKSFKEAVAQLLKWGLINQNRQITEKGLLVQSGPLDIERSLLFVELSSRGWQPQAARLLAFMDAGRFEFLNSALDLDDIHLPEQARRAEQQLLQMQITFQSAAGSLKQAASRFNEALIQTYFDFFPHKIAQKKEGNQAISSLGRGVEIISSQVKSGDQYFLLLNGRDLNSATTLCDLIFGFSQNEFEKLGQSQSLIQSQYAFDEDRMAMFKTEKKLAGYFVISESPKVYVSEKENPVEFKKLFLSQFSDLLQKHDDYKNYVTRVEFLKRKATLLGLSEQDFEYLARLENLTFESLSETVTSLKEFFTSPLKQIMIFQTPEHLQKLIRNLPSHFTLPSGKVVPIDYTSEQAPKISARIQEFFGLAQNPTLIDGKINFTVELLAPNYRPTQVTSQLGNFWKASYHEIKKELKARYPKHAWPDDPATYKHLPRQK